VSRIHDLIRKTEWQAEAPPRQETPFETVQVDLGRGVFVHTDPRSPYADRLRFLRVRLRELWNTEKLKRLLITSPLPHDGKSTVALNLATVLAERGKRSVLLIEGDLHHPTLSQQLGMGVRPGLAECLENGLDPLAVVRRVEPLGLHLFPAGRARTNPTELLQTDALPAVIQPLLRYFDWVLFDSPPVMPLADALSLKRQADATLLVARAGRTPTEVVEEAITLLGRKHVLGIILNGVEGLDQVYSKYYGSYGTGAST